MVILNYITSSQLKKLHAHMVYKIPARVNATGKGIGKPKPKFMQCDWWIEIFPGLHSFFRGSKTLCLPSSKQKNPTN